MMRALRNSRFVRETTAGPIVEFAVIVPVVIFLLLGTIDFALAFNQRLNIVSVTRDLARVFSVAENPCNAAAQTAIRMRADSIFVRQSRSDPLLSTYVTLTPVISGGSCTLSDRVQVRVTGYPLRSSFLRLGPFSLSANSVFRWERAN